MRLHHLTSIKHLSREQIEAIFVRAVELSSANPIALSTRSQHMFVGNIFFEPSTRTRLSFETAAKRLGMQVMTMNESTSSRVKGESYLDTVLTLEAMGCEAFVIRSKDETVCKKLANVLDHVRPHVHIINAGGGKKDHPTQGLLDVFTMQQSFSDLQDKKICIIGDIKHSRVARSTAQVLRRLDVENIHLVAPENLLPSPKEFTRCNMTTNIEEGLKDADVVMTLRIQKERMQESDIPSNEEYHRLYGLDSDRLALANEHAIVMHPGPMNRGVEITGAVADGIQSVITDQVANGVLIRMAILDLMLN